MTHLPTAWRNERLGGLLEVLLDHRGKTPGKLGGEFQSEGVPVISAIHIKAGRVDFSQRFRFVDHEMFLKWMPRPLRKGDVLLTSEAPLGSVAEVPDDSPLVLSQRLFALRGKAGALENKYLRWVLEAPIVRDQIFSRSSGSTVTGIRQSELVNIKLPLPPVTEQRRIVDILEDHLSRLDAAGRDLMRAEINLSKLRSVELARAPELRDAPTQTLHEVLAEPLINGRSVPTREGGFPVLRLTSLKEGVLDLAERKEGAWTESDAQPFLIKRGDFLVSRGNGSLHLVGRGGLVDIEPDGVAFPDTMIRVRTKREKLTPNYLQIIWNSVLIRRQIESAARTTAGIYKINQGNMERIVLPVPVLEAQIALVARMGNLDDISSRTAQAMESSKKRSASLRHAILTAAFSGRLTGHASDMDQVEEMAGV